MISNVYNLDEQSSNYDDIYHHICIGVRQNDIQDKTKNDNAET